MAAFIRSPLRVDTGLLEPKDLAPCFALPPQPNTPRSEVTDISDSEWREDGSEEDSIFEDDSPIEMPELSRRSSGMTTTSLSDAVKTPLANQNPFESRGCPTHSTQGPTGPHLFSPKSEISRALLPSQALQLSPLFPRDLRVQMNTLIDSPMDFSDHEHSSETMKSAPPSADTLDVRDWTSSQVASWMYTAGFEESIVDKFEEHDINGAVLLDLQVQDLKELDIPSFGKRHQIWSELRALRAVGDLSPAPTMFENASRPATRLTSTRDGSRSRKAEAVTSTRRRNRRNKHPTNDPVMPGESVSIVAIEQLLPKPHKCSKGEDCPKWRKQQRLRDRLDREYGYEISPTEIGSFFLVGNPGNVDSTPNMNDKPTTPRSETLPSVVASSDLFSPGQKPEMALKEGSLRNVSIRDPQDNVQQYLDFQRVATPMQYPRLEAMPISNVSAPVYIPAPPAPLANLRLLPKLDIPRLASTELLTASLGQGFTTSIYHHGTPASETDIPQSQLASTPILRDISHSVPPNMHFRPPTKHMLGSRDPPSWRRLSMVLPTLRENDLASPAGSVAPNAIIRGSHGEIVTHAGWMKKRKTRLLRHEWPKHHYRLYGTELAMHNSARPDDHTALDTINVDDYFVSCVTRAGNSKLASALKALRVTSGREPGNETPFGFQLVPAANRPKSAKQTKTHHFAVAGKEERSEWMREVMLAKALKQRGEGFKVTVNGEAV